MHVSGISSGLESIATRQQVSLAVLKQSNDAAKTQANALLGLLESATQADNESAEANGAPEHDLDVTA